MNKDLTCSVDECDRPVYGRGLCNMHYQRQKRHGSTESLTPMRGKPLEERFWRLVDKTEDCWMWTGHKNPEGYGNFANKGVTWKAHRLAYTLVVGEIPEDMTLDHDCNNPPCVRPDHLQPMSRVDNVMKGNGACVRNRDKTHCKYGHEFIAGISHGRPCRVCKVCEKLRTERRAAERRALRTA